MIKTAMQALRKVPPRAIPFFFWHIASINFSFFAEDKILFKLQPCAGGFYVDVGAFHPIHGSNTYKLYLKGWRGITIEPNPKIARLFKQLRPSDCHLTIGISSEPGTLTYHEFADPSKNTFDPESAKAASSESSEVGRTPIECLPLATILDQHAPGQAIDLLSVDAEGLDLAVLQSLDWTRQRPTVVVVEDYEHFNSGTSRVPTFSAIRSFMIAQDYSLVAQTIISFVYVDKNAIGRDQPRTGFQTNNWWWHGHRV